MKKVDLNNILNEYLESRKTNLAHSDSTFRKKLKQLGKNESEINETLIELIDEYGNELAYDEEIKSGRRNIIIGGLITVVVLIIQLFAIFGLPGQNSMILASTGIAGGLGIMLKGFSDKKRTRLKRKRRKIKWRSW